MVELPLFPLNSVLFPGAPIHLHIFEDRYKRMMRVCLDTTRLFGVVLIRRGEEAHGPLAEPYSVGCLTRIVDTQNLPEGRLYITAVGQERFRVLSIDEVSQPYLVGHIEPYPLVNPQPDAFRDAVFQLQPLVEQYVKLLTETGGQQVEFKRLPEDPTGLAFAAATLLRVPLAAKQELLSIEQAQDLANTLRRIFRREVALLKIVSGKGSPGEAESFSRN